GPDVVLVNLLTPPGKFVFTVMRLQGSHRNTPDLIWNADVADRLRSQFVILDDSPYPHEIFATSTVRSSVGAAPPVNASSSRSTSLSKSPAPTAQFASTWS